MNIVMEILFLIIGAILLSAPLYVIYRIIKDLMKSYFKELNSKEIEEIKKLANARVKIYETDFPILRFNGCCLGNIVLVSKDFVEKGGGYLRGVVAHEIGHYKKKHLIISLLYFAPILYLFYSNINLLLKSVLTIPAIIIFIVIGQKLQKQADEFAFSIVGKDVITPLEYIYENRNRMSNIGKIKGYILNFILYQEFNPNKDLEDRISSLNSLLNKESKKGKKVIE
ncbi:MAG: M48 family metalloprotease [Candidatus Aenigmatarchaeota archaeon]